jgi:hypothetical protein
MHRFHGTRDYESFYSCIPPLSPVADSDNDTTRSGQGLPLITEPVNRSLARYINGLRIPGRGYLRDRPTRETRLEAASQSVSSARREKCPRLSSESLWLPIVSRRSLGSPLSGGDTPQPSIDANSLARACINFITFSHH